MLLIGKHLFKVIDNSGNFSIKLASKKLNEILGYSKLIEFDVHNNTTIGRKKENTIEID